MKRYCVTILLLTGLLFMSIPAIAQTFHPQLKKPNEKVIAEARKMAEGLFADLKTGNSEKMAKWVVEQIGYAWDASTKLKNMNEFKSKLDIILLSPPQNAYGQLDGYDLIDESYLPGSNRYFRLTYISYHEGAPLIWQFRFYVKPDGKIAVNHIGWSDDNPFEYLSTSDMLLQRWYEKW
jgi:hypothetical protein